MDNEIDFYIDTECGGINDFDCGFPVFNDYLKKHIPKDKAAFHYIVNSENDSLIAYFSLLASSVFLSNSTDSNIMPAIELKMFAVDKKYQGRNLSNRLVDAIINIVSEYSSEYVGAEILILYSVPTERVVSMYEKSGFEKLPSEWNMYKSWFSDGCVPMYRIIE